MLIDYLTAYFTNFTLINNPNGAFVLIIIAAVLLYFAGKEEHK